MITGSWVNCNIAANSVANAVTSEVDLGRQYERALIIVPTLSNETALSIQVAEKTGSSTFYAVCVTPAASGNSVPLKSANGKAAFAWVAPIGGFQFLKIQTEANITTAATLRICGVRS